MPRFFLSWILLSMGITACSGLASAQVDAEPTVASAAAGLPDYQPRFGRGRPVVAVVGENYYTELTDYVVPYGILAASGVAEVLALATRSGPIRMFPAPMQIEPHATIAEFDARFPQGADYVVVPAVHRDTDPALVGWVTEQARKGAVVVGVCDGVWVLANAGLLQHRKATGHWFSLDRLQRKFPQTQWQRNARYVADGPVVTTTGVTASIPVSLALVEAIGGSARAADLSLELGAVDMRSSDHPSDRFKLSLRHMLTYAGNTVAIWSHRDVGISLEPGIDEIALALQAEVYSATLRSTAYTVAQGAEAVVSRRGLAIIPDRVANASASLRMLPPVGGVPPLHMLDQTLEAVEADYGRRTAEWVALQMEYPGY